jgi:hypothetical protein
MKYSSRIMILCVAVIFTAAFAGPKAFAGSAAGAQQNSGTRIQEIGKLFADNYNCNISGPGI